MNWEAFARSTTGRDTRTEAALTDCHNKSPDATSITVATAGHRIQPVRGIERRARCSA